MKDRYVVISQTYTNDNLFYSSYIDALTELKRRRSDEYFGDTNHLVAKVIKREEGEDK